MNYEVIDSGLQGYPDCNGKPERPCRDSCRTEAGLVCKRVVMEDTLNQEAWTKFLGNIVRANSKED